MSKKISIIVPVYNVEKYLKKCLDSLISQTYQNLEIILINDGSTDKSLDICYEYSKNDSRVKVINKKNEGVSIARNIGINVASGDYIFFIDSDDWIDLNAIEKMIKNLGNYNIVKMSYKLIINDCDQKNIINYGVYKEEDYIKKIVCGDIGGHSWGYLIKRSIIDDIRFDKNTSCMEDTLFIISCIKNTGEVICINDSFYYHIINENGITCSIERAKKNIFDYIYSLDQIRKLINENNQKYILKKYIYILEAEMAKIEDMSELNEIINDSRIRDIFTEAKSEKININFIYKIYMYCVINKKINILSSYFRVRGILKKVKNRRSIWVK